MQLNIKVGEKQFDLSFIFDASKNADDIAAAIVDLLYYVRGERFLDEIKTLIKSSLKAEKRDDIIECVNKIVKTKSTAESKATPKGPMIRPLDVFASPRRKK